MIYEEQQFESKGIAYGHFSKVVLQGLFIYICKSGPVYIQGSTISEDLLCAMINIGESGIQ